VCVFTPILHQACVCVCVYVCVCVCVYTHCSMGGMIEGSLQCAPKGQLYPFTLVEFSEAIQFALSSVCCSVSATHCNALQRTATHCNTLQNIDTLDSLFHPRSIQRGRKVSAKVSVLQCLCKTLQPAATQRYKAFSKAVNVVLSKCVAVYLRYSATQCVSNTIRRFFCELLVGLFWPLICLVWLLKGLFWLFTGLFSHFWLLMGLFWLFIGLLWLLQCLFWLELGLFWLRTSLFWLLLGLFWLLISLSFDCSSVSFYFCWVCFDFW